MPTSRSNREGVIVAHPAFDTLSTWKVIYVNSSNTGVYVNLSATGQSVAFTFFMPTTGFHGASKIIIFLAGAGASASTIRVSQRAVAAGENPTTEGSFATETTSSVGVSNATTALAITPVAGLAAGDMLTVTVEITSYVSDVNVGGAYITVY